MLGSSNRIFAVSSLSTRAILWCPPVRFCSFLEMFFDAMMIDYLLAAVFQNDGSDMGDLLEDDQVILPRKQLAVKRRLVTLFCYLNSLDTKQGGCTYFPKVC